MIRSCFGTPLTTAQVLDTAILRFNTALAHPSIVAGDPIHSLASVGLGRALLDQGRFAEAAAAVASVPPEFLYETEHSTTPAALHNGDVRGIQQRRVRRGGSRRAATGCPTSPPADVRVTGDSGVASDNNTETLVSQQVFRLRRIGHRWRITPKPNSSLPRASFRPARTLL